MLEALSPPTTPRPQYQDQKEGRTDQCRQNTQFQFRSSNNETDGNIGGQRQHGTAERAGGQQSPRPVTNDGPQQVRYHQADKSNHARHRHGGAHRQRRADDCPRLKPAQIDAKALRDILSQGQGIQSAAGRGKEDNPGNNERQGKDDMIV